MRFSQVVGSAGWSVAGQVSPPAIWGKLPTHADYLQHGVRADEVPGWQRWLGGAMRPQPAQAAQRASAPASKRPRRTEPWLSLEPARYKPAPSSIPVAFVLPPGTLAFAPQQHVVGVVASSCDRLGREHPIIVYQRVNERWLRHSLAPAGGVGESEFAFGAEADRLERQNWLFWLARLVSRYVATPEENAALADDPDGPDGAVTVPGAWHSANGPVSTTGPIGSTSSTSATSANGPNSSPGATGATGLSRMSLEAAVAQLWALHAPGWSQWVGVAKPRPALAQLQQVIDGAAPPRDFDAADQLRGVGHLPWADWPARLSGAQAQPAFWQQDAYGGYVGATLRLAELWERRP
ncbi:MAG: type secretion system-associated protein TagF [Rhodoferax sp.]|nr:type secretion system-associated protein TagF [Rhodoferax sp.]